MASSLFCVVSNSDSKQNSKENSKVHTYFIEPTQAYFDKFGREFIDQICPKYSYGHLNKLAICRIYQFDNEVHITHFNNYVREYYIQNKQKFSNDIYKGLGTLLLKNILQYMVNLDSNILDNKIYLDMVNTKNKKLVKFYESLSFVLYDEDNFLSTIRDVMHKLQDYFICNILYIIFTTI